MWPNFTQQTVAMVMTEQKLCDMTLDSRWECLGSSGSNGAICVPLQEAKPSSEGFEVSVLLGHTVHSTGLDCCSHPFVDKWVLQTN